MPSIGASRTATGFLRRKNDPFVARVVCVISSLPLFDAATDPVESHVKGAVDIVDPTTVFSNDEN